MKKTIIIILLAVLVLVAALALPGLHTQLRQESREAIRDAVLRSAVQCYAVEGVYPESLAYLEEHYGLRVNHRDYIVTYQAFASNCLPDVQVLVRGDG